MEILIMKNVNQARFVSLSFMFLAISLLMLFNPFAGKAQNNSAVSLAGTEWSTIPVTVPTYSTDNSITTLTRCLVFYKQGKVEAAILRNKSAGGEYKYVYSNEYNPVTGRYELQLVNKYVPTLPEFTPQAWQGKYEIKGKSVYLDFPGFTINATVSGDSMKGLVTYKDTNQKEEWLLSLLASNKDNLRGRNSASSESRENGSSDLSEKPQPSPVLTGALLTIYDKELVLVDGKLRPAKGYRWVNPKDPKDFQIEPIP
jgi:hypothetical protein